jgi:hypothetical protein
LTVHSWNAQSIGNKTAILVDHVLENDIDLMFLSETWLFPTDTVIIGELTPPSYKFLNFPRDSVNRGGGIGVLYKQSMDLTVSPSSTYISFEHCIVTLKNSIDFVMIYRPTPSKANGFKTSQFLEEVDVFLDELSVKPHKVVLLGDFNVHMNKSHEWDVRRFSDTLTRCGFKQLITRPTHVSGNTIDLLITRDEDHLVQQCEVLSRLSDHHVIACTLNCTKPPPMMVTVSARQYGKMDRTTFRDLLKDRCSEGPIDAKDPNVLVDMFEAACSSVLDQVCPVVHRKRVVKPRLPWYNDAVHQARRVRRKLERKWCKSRAEADELVFRTQKDYVAQLITSAKMDYFSSKFSTASSKVMYATINGLLNNTTKALPVCDSSDSDLANEFLSFFNQKIEKIRANVVSDSFPHSNPPNSVPCPNIMSRFESLTCADVEKIIKVLSNKSCALDSLPCWLIKENLDIVLPVITKITNCSLATGIFPRSLKQSIITPILKKASLDANTLANYRPVANIKFLAEVIEKVVSSQVRSHVDSFGLGEKYQSSYKKHHSTETALLRVKNDALQFLDDNKAVLLVLLDMSAAFDTVDHSILVQRLENCFGLHERVSSWFKSYLCDRSTRVTIKNDFSREHILTCSVPQGSIIGPQGFIMYTHPVGDIIREHDLSFHFYADDMQIYSEFHPKIPGDCDRVLHKLALCVSRVSAWMLQNGLQINRGKTEFFVIASSRVLHSLPDVNLQLDDVTILPKDAVKNLGVVFDSTLSMSKHIGNVCKTVNFHIRNLWRIRRFITQDACHHAVRALILSRIDYANSLLYGARQVDIQRLQRLQNKAARLVFACGRDQSSDGLLQSLHWLPVRQRITFKILLYTFKCLNNLAPSYLVDLIKLLTDDVSHGYRHRLRSSSDATKLIVPRSKKRAGDNSFAVIAPKLWNDIPVAIRESASVLIFKKRLKTYLFPS